VSRHPPPFALPAPTCLSLSTIAFQHVTINTFLRPVQVMVAHDLRKHIGRQAIVSVTRQRYIASISSATFSILRGGLAPSRKRDTNRRSAAQAYKVSVQSATSLKLTSRPFSPCRIHSAMTPRPDPITGVPAEKCFKDHERPGFHPLRGYREKVITHQQRYDSVMWNRCKVLDAGIVSRRRFEPSPVFVICTALGDPIEVELDVQVRGWLVP
jgi:hypothetical protein